MLFQNLPQFVLTYLRFAKFTCRTFCHRSTKRKKLTTESTRLQKELIDKKSVSRAKRNDYLYIKNTKDAECVASYLCRDWMKGYILEANPGPGALTKAILNNGVAYLRVFEKQEEFLPALKELSLKYSNLDIVSDDMMFLPSLEARLSTNESSSLDSFFSDIPECAWEGGISFRFFSIIYGKRCIKFLRYLLAVLPNKGSLFSLGRCEFFLIIPENEYLYMLAEPKLNFARYRWVTVLYRVFFDIQFLEKFSPEILHSAVSHRKKAMKERNFYLMKLTPRPDLFSFIVNGNRLPDFYFFVRHHLIKRTGLVIPTLEGWIPSCGPRLIKEGMHFFTKFGDLSPKQILELFNQFSSWPEYEDSSFCTALQRYYGKCPLSFEEDSNV
ncbi:dimethyladenosine transferase 2, mitochondrial [Parasteatoda tepidariorum]|uniref:dimethyladenosine transferase 2, mitochondrial n=1 Tax=Parasteatoda tepidariorum TaxID=114398 RepID=UPI00077F96A4|nr:dimethyladenosine transferase 2, mitochondrial [Parasteatoda tepidariorum]